MFVILHIYSSNILVYCRFIYLIYYFYAPLQNMPHSFIRVISNVLISRTHPLLEYLIQRDDGLSQEHVQADQHPMHDCQDQVCAAWWVGVPATVLQDPRKQLKRALLVPLGHLHLLHQSGGILLLTHLDDSVEIAASMLALGSESSRSEDGDIDVRGHPPLVIVQINQRHHLAPLRDDADGLLRFLLSFRAAQKRTSALSPK